MWYHVSDANSYLVITGGGVKDVKIVKKAWILPWQKFSIISISPFDFEITLQAMTIEKLQFTLPAVFTIGPDDSPDALTKYAKILTGKEVYRKTTTVETGRNHVQDIVKGIIEGETRVIVSGLSMEEIFKERQVFKTKVIENVQSELNQFGLRIYNANVKELQDTPGSEYFTFLSRKAHEGASNQAKIDVAQARMIGQVGEAEKQSKARQEISKIDAQTAVLETQRKSEKAEAEAQLTTTQTKLNMGINLANIQATRQAEAKDAELQRDVETKRAEMELERRRATDVVHAKIQKESAAQKAEAKYFTDIKDADALLYKHQKDIQAYTYRANGEAEANAIRVTKEAEAAFEQAKIQKESSQQKAEAKYVSDTKEADAVLYKQQKDTQAVTFRATGEAEANAIRVTKQAEVDLLRTLKKAEGTRAEAEAAYFRATKEAEAALFAKQKEAKATMEMAEAYGQMAKVLGGPQGLLQYLMLKDNTYERLAQANAAAINGLQPKISVWNTGSSSDGAADPSAPIRNIFQNLPPLFSTIQEQTGIAPPNWMVQMPPPPATAAAVNGDRDTKALELKKGRS